MSELIYKDEVYAIPGAAMEVHRVLGSGILEADYQEAIEIELHTRNIPREPHKILQVKYEEHILKKEYVAEMVCYEKIIVEFKAPDNLTGRGAAQLINYLKVTGYKVGVLVNFGSHPKLEWKRFVH